MKLVIASLLIAASLYAPNAKAEPKAYQFAFDQKMSELACLEKSIEVAAENKLVIQPKNSSGDHALNDAEGESAGTAYYSQGSCHIYIN